MDWNSLKQSLSPRQRFNRDVLWNLGSLAILGVAGIVLNFVIGKYLGESALGVFNQVYAIYIVLSQLAVGGVHTSVLKHVSYHQDNPQKCSHIMTTALLLAFLLSCAVCGIAYLGSDLTGNFLDSPGVTTGLRLALPGLLFFSLNKILLNTLNGARNMRAFAVFSALRFILILLTIIALIVLRKPAEILPLAFSVAEVLLFAGLLTYVTTRLFALRLPGSIRGWLGEHFSFGVRGVLSGIVSDLNTRVDVLMLGFFLNDDRVGVYSMAAILAEGFFMLPVVIQRNVNPILGKCFAEEDTDRIQIVARKIRRLLHPGMALIGLGACLAYPLLMRLAFPGKDFVASWPAFCILMAGVVVLSGYAPMGGILFQGGRPGMQTVLMVLVVLGNAAMNAVLIPIFQINGSAAATGCAYVLQAILILVFARRLFGVKLWR
ncbi:MAG: oligosaccharide flippase family protein [Phycisphaerales bacterium]|nr:oligosaccharide flippase family protein [Phycisphaerales bacterium]